MTIGFIIPQTPLYSETFFKAEIELLLETGHEVILFVWKKNKDFDLDVKVNKELSFPSNIFLRVLMKIFILISTFFFYPKRLVSYIKLLRRQELDAFSIISKVFANHHILKSPKLDWLHFGYLNMTVNKELLAKVLNTKMAVSLRGADIGVEPILKKGMYDNLWQHVDKVHAASDDLLSKAYEVGLPTSTPVQKRTPTLASHFTYQGNNSIGFKHGKPIQILTISRLHWKKGFDYVLKSLAILKKNKIPFEYIVLGEGEERDRILYEIHDLKLSKEVHLKGRVSHEEVKEYLLKAEICLNYSIQEGFCIGALEAQAMGKLCIVSDAEGLSENVENGKSGWVLPRREPVLLAAKIEEVYNMPEEKLLEISRYASQRVQRKFSSKNQKKEILEFYR